MYCATYNALQQYPTTANRHFAGYLPDSALICSKTARWRSRLLSDVNVNYRLHRRRKSADSRDYDRLFADDRDQLKLRTMRPKEGDRSPPGDGVHATPSAGGPADHRTLTAGRGSQEGTARTPTGAAPRGRCRWVPAARSAAVGLAMRRAGRLPRVRSAPAKPRDRLPRRADPAPPCGVR